MAELPGLGERCALATCSQLDFLPIVCSHCEATFCRHHVSADQHSCEKVPIPKQADLSAVPATYGCHVADCGATELTPVVCPDCGRSVCLSHRHGSEHGCPVWQQRQRQQQQQAEASRHADAVQAARLAEAPALPEPRSRSQKARKTAATVQLMRLKQRATGDGRVPLGDRHYLLVVGPGGRGAPLPVYVSRRWTLGRCVDALADMCRVQNDNDRTGGRRLGLFRRPDGGRVTAPMDQTIAELPAGELDNATTVVLDYWDPGLEKSAEHGS